MRSLGVPLLLLLLWRRAAWAESSHSIPVPQNLTIESYNCQNKLRWSPVNTVNSSVSYTVESSLKGLEHWEEVVNCTNITKPECDFEEVKFYIINLRVRAQQGELKSNWTMTPPFQVEGNTTLGPPKNINISARANSLFISFEQPFKEPSLFFEYIIYYWDNSSKTNHTLETTHTEVTLKNLKQRTVYCLQIKAVFASNFKGQLSAPYCKETAVTDATRILYVTLIFGFVVFILFAVFLCLMAVRKYQDAIKSLWRPPLAIPFHFEEDLQNSQIVFAEFKNSAGEEHWDTLSVISNAEES
ncbi:interferon gamma receptor 2 isoform X2 [Tiliqua scincoides]|uniref:interferon gamma receptor 2 isoform X2 n=1 Tax=Tiliqua scincoides TaxID=71010 RepID=UPI0034621D93